MTADWNILLPYFSVPRSKTAAAKSDARAAAIVRGQSGAAMRKAKALAALHPRINIEKEAAGAYWVTCDLWDDDEADPLYGSHFCSDGQEVLEAVNVYVNAGA